MKRAIAGSAALLLVALLVGWRYFRSQPEPSDDGASDITPDRTPSQVAEAATGSRKHQVPVFDDRPALRAQIEELTREREEQKREEEQKCVTSVTSSCPFLAPSQKILREMARCAVVRADMPIPPSKSADQEAESPEVAQVSREFWQRTTDDLQALHRNLVGKPEIPNDVETIVEEIERAIPADLSDRIRRTIARERAGLASAPTSQELASRPAAERFWRMRLALGDDYEDMLAQKLGSARARSLRAERDGWPGKAVFAGQCEPGTGGSEPALR